MGFCARNVCHDDRAIMMDPSYNLGKGEAQAWPRSRDHVAEVLKWVVGEDNVDKKYSGDASRVVLAGNLAGGHLATCVGLDRDLLSKNGFDARIVKALFLVNCLLGIRADP